MRARTTGVLVARAICASLAISLLFICGCKSQDNTPPANPEINTTQEEEQLPSSDTMVIATERGNLYYSDEWEGVVSTTQETLGDSLVVTFTTDAEGQSIGLFKVYIDGSDSDGFVAGSITDTSGNLHPVYIQVDDHSNLDGFDEGTKDRIYAMTDGVNTLIEHLD